MNVDIGERQSEAAAASTAGEPRANRRREVSA
jgi:hypothetical protein